MGANVRAVFLLDLMDLAQLPTADGIDPERYGPVSYPSVWLV
jgi:hypothetical protein